MAMIFTLVGCGKKAETVTPKVQKPVTLTISAELIKVRRERMI